MFVSNRGRQGGMGLVELLVAIVISLIVLAGAIFVFVGNSESSLLHLRTTRFVQQMRDAMDRMVRDVRRAGYMGYRYLAATSVIMLDNPFSSYAMAVSSGSMTTAVVGEDCTAVSVPTPHALCGGITYAYNLDDDGTRAAVPPTVGNSTACSASFDTTNVELFGFRFNRNAGTVEMRTQGNCTTAGGTWVPITDPNVVQITNLGFVLTETCSAYVDLNGNKTGTCAAPEAGDLLVNTRQVEIRLSGRSPRDATMTFDLSQVVDLPNDSVRRVP